MAIQKASIFPDKDCSGEGNSWAVQSSPKFHTIRINATVAFKQ